MSINKRIAIGAAALAITGAAATATALAATSTSTNSTYPPIVQKIADKFHLSPADVNDVFQQQKQMNKEEKKQRLNDYLEQKVKDGTITEDQKNKVVAKLDELHQQLKNEDKDQRHQDLQTLKTQFEQWAKDNGINNIDQLLPRHDHVGGMHKMTN